LAKGKENENGSSKDRRNGPEEVLQVAECV